ncbi:unnamed protein product [Porites evermanni]|uniref:Uncharacterized protein n=1 Tax=Porites evermanni TaxID=104178 RepID=A0ABN8Q2B1_9CNID|nr:unnamed protein product [Porites evermanni]
MGRVSRAGRELAESWPRAGRELAYGHIRNRWGVPQKEGWTGISREEEERKSKKVEEAGSGPFLFPTCLGRSKGLCSQGR